MMIIPIGSWCRTAYQVNKFLKENGIKPTAFPYDWTITSFFSLKITLGNEFDLSSILQNKSLRQSRIGSIEDNYTGLIHHHDFPPQQIKYFEQISPLNPYGIPQAIFAADLISKAKVRFMHSYENLESLKRAKSKALFIRWQREGHPDYQIPDAFDGESISSLAEILYGFLLHDNFSILTIQTKTIDGNLPAEIILEYKKEPLGTSSTIIERKGFNGDGTSNFKGDTISWHRVLSKFVQDEKYRFS